MANTRNFAWLVGDYVGNHERQQQAKEAGCKLVLEFHFNSGESTTQGGEVWFKSGDTFSENIAKEIRTGFQGLKLPLLDPSVNEATTGTKAGWLPFYSGSVVLLEPLFLSNADQAEWIHDAANLAKLAQAIAAACIKTTATGDLIGLSIGHRFKHSSPHDNGARCEQGDFEADHAQVLALSVASELAGPQVGDLS